MAKSWQEIQVALDNANVPPEKQEEVKARFWSNIASEIPKDKRAAVYDRFMKATGTPKKETGILEDATDIVEGVVREAFPSKTKAPPRVVPLEQPRFTSARGIASVNPDGSDEQSMDGGRNSGRRPQESSNDYFDKLPRTVETLNERPEESSEVKLPKIVDAAGVSIKQYLEAGTPISDLEYNPQTNRGFTQRELDIAGVRQTTIEEYRDKGIYPEGTGVDRIAKLMDIRAEEYQSMKDRFVSGETGANSAALQVVGKQIAGRFADVAGVALLESLKMVVPDFIETPIAEKMIEGVEALGGTDFIKSLNKSWDELDDNEKANWQSVGNLAAVATSGKYTPTKLIPRGDKIRLDKLGDQFDPPVTGDVETALAKNMGIRAIYDQEVLETVNKIKGIVPSSITGDAVKKNLEVINGRLDKTGRQIDKGELGKIEAKLQAKLKAVKTPLRVQAIKDQVNAAMDNYTDAQKAVFATDASIEGAFKLNVDRLFPLLDELSTAGEITASNLMKARRALDASIKESGKAAFNPANVTATSMATKVSRDITKEILETAVNGSGKTASILPDLKKYSHTIVALERLVENSKSKKGIWAKVGKELKAHPIMVASAVGLTGGGIGFNNNPALLGAVGAGTALLGAHALGRSLLSRSIPAKIQGAVMKPIDKASVALDRQGLLGAAGRTGAVSNRVILNEGLDRTNQEIQMRRQRGLMGG